MSYNIAIDGPAGAGKSSIAKMVACRLNFIYVDTGALYRAIAYYLIKNGITEKDEELIGAYAKEANVTIQYQNQEQQVFLNGENITSLIRTPNVGKMASLAAKNELVRERLYQIQVNLAKEFDVIMDGRDIGTRILPNADLKIYLTASPEERANRRWKEMVEKGISCKKEEIKKDIIERDAQDKTRKIAPLKQAEDAVLLDSSNLSMDEVAEKIIACFEEKKLRKKT